MAQETFADWDSASSSNATIEGDATDGSVNIAEGCPPGNVNNALRTVMAACNLAFGAFPSGSSRPAYLTANRVWLDTTSATAPVLKMYDGTDDITVFTFNYTSNTITFSGTISGFDISGLTALTAPDIADYLAIYDASAGTNKKILFDDLMKTIDGMTAASFAQPADKIVVYDDSAADGRSMTLEAMLLCITLLTAETAPATADSLLLYDQSAAAMRRMTFVNFLKVVNELTADASPDGSADYVLTYDASASAAKKVLINNLFASGAVAQTLIAVNSTRTALSTTMPHDNTLPQITEGVEIATVAITPTNASSTILIEGVVQCAMASNGTYTTAAIFIDSDADAIGATAQECDSSVAEHTFPFMFTHSPGDTSAHTYRLRVGNSSSGSYVNGTTSADLFSTAGPVCTLKITEILP